MIANEEHTKNRCHGGQEEADGKKEVFHSIPIKYRCRNRDIWSSMCQRSSRAREFKNESVKRESSSEQKSNCSVHVK
jgi:hypothetical protein